VAVEIQDRPDFHNMSHYRVPIRLDGEAMLSNLIVVDEDTAAFNGAWLKSIEACNIDTNGAIERESSHQPSMGGFQDLGNPLSSLTFLLDFLGW